MDAVDNENGRYSKMDVADNQNDRYPKLNAVRKMPDNTLPL